jgi:organic hydroperoxide reductase OsmC/OhrA
MSKTAVYNTTVSWKGAHWGHMVMGNGPEMAFSAPPDAKGHAGVLTPEDAYVGAINSCIMMMFIWASERFKLDLRSYDCCGEGTKVVALDHTELFSEVRLWPVIKVGGQGQDAAVVEKRVRKALKSAEKYSLIANSVKSSLIVEPDIEVVL